MVCPFEVWRLIHADASSTRRDGVRFSSWLRLPFLAGRVQVPVDALGGGARVLGDSRIRP